MHKKPINVPVENNNGYPNKVANTQTMRIRGAGAATKGANFNPKCC